MGCTHGQYQVAFYADGVPLSCPPKDSGCKGEIRRFSVTTNLPEPVSYRWSLDGVTLSSKAFLDYKYDDKVHRLLVTVTSNVFSFAVYITTTGKTCQTCPVSCVSQTVDFSAGEMISLEDETGKLYQIQKDITTVCKKNSNQVAAKAIRKAIHDNSDCGMANMNVAIYYRGLLRNCLSLVITNSPIVFRFLKVGGTKFAIDTTHCTP